MDTDKLLTLATVFESLAKGRSEKSVKKQYKTMTKGKEHPFTTMVQKFKKHPDDIEDPEGLAAWMKDLGKGTTKWRGKEKS